MTDQAADQKQQDAAQPPKAMPNINGSNSSNNVNTSNALDSKALLYMALLAIQFGLQPILTRRYTPTTVARSTVVLMQEFSKFVIAFVMLRITDGVQSATKGWTVREWVSVAAVPAGLYAIQNLFSLQAYQTLDALTYNVLNQTKTLSAAACCYLVMGRKQSKMQIVALLVLLLAAFVIEGIVTVDGIATSLTFVLNRGKNSTLEEGQLLQQSAEDGANTSRWGARHFTHGVAPLLIASFISGLAGALSQKNLQARKSKGGSGKGRNAYLFTMELCAASVVILGISLFVSPDGRAIYTDGFWKGWTLQTWIPVATMSGGGVLVGLVTKYAGSVRKGFALILGIFLSGLVQAALLPEQEISKEQLLGGMLAAASLYVHATNPPKPTAAVQQQQQQQLPAKKTTKQE